MRMETNSRSRNKLISRIDVSAFASVTIVLIAVVILSAMSTGVPFHSNLPRVSHPAIILGQSRPDAIVISVFGNGEVWYRKEQITLAGISSRISAQAKNGHRINRVYIEADGRAKCRLVTDVLSEIQKAGVVNVSFVVSPWSGLPH